MAINLPAAIAGVGMVSVPVVALLYAWIAKGQRPAKPQAISAAVLVVLAWLLFDPAYVALNALGVGALFGALLTIVIGSTLVQTLSVSIHWWVVLTWQLIIGGTILLLAAVIDGSFINPEQITTAFLSLFQRCNTVHYFGYCAQYSDCLYFICMVTWAHECG